MQSALHFEKVDHVPVFLNNTLPVTRLTNASVRDINLNEDKFVEALLAGYHHFGYDGIRVGIDVTIEAEAIGCRLNYPEYDFASVADHILESSDDFDKLKLPDPHTSGRMPMILNATRRIYEEIGHEAFVGTLIMGPGVLASQLLGAQELMIAFIEEPEFVDKLLEFCTQVTIDFGTAARESGAHGIVMGEAMCSPQTIGPGLYRRFLQPCHKVVIEEFKRRGIENHIFHICGNTMPILSDVAETGARGLDVDAPLDMQKGRDILGDKLAFLGNISPATLLNGSVEQVENACRKALETPKGLVLNAGCCMALQTPPENIHAMVRMASQVGTL